ncbi:cytochrome P450 [Pseudorhodoferax soli]|nr:cytochrome P450 [Pseudorhodoferax soli]
MPPTTSSAAAPRHGVGQLQAWDSTLAFAADPYRFIARACAAQGTRGVRGRLLLQPTVFLTGAAAARVFYESPQLLRHDAAPGALLATLIGRGGVQTLDGAAHRHRKAMFLHLLRGPAVGALLQAAEARWTRCVQMAHHGDTASGQALYPLMQHWLFETAMAWAGVPMPPADERPRCERAMVDLFDSAASSVPGHLRARASRRWLQRWLGRCIEDARDARPVFRADGAALAIALHRDPDGLRLPTEVAAVELLNVLRPIVAVSVFVTWCQHALLLHPHARALLDSDSGVLAFVQEVRRFYPFFPAATARVHGAFDADGLHFRDGERVLLDLYGTSRDPLCWEQPDEFRPARFLQAAPGRYSFVPQGGGDAALHHRCPGEDFAVALMALAVRRLAGTRCNAATDDLSIDMRRLPALPRMELCVRGLGPVPDTDTPPGEPTQTLHTSVRLGRARVFVQIRPVPPLDWRGMLDTTAQQRVAITRYAAAALREGRHSVCLRAVPGSVSLDDAPTAPAPGPARRR